MTFGFPAYHTEELEYTESVPVLRERVVQAIRSLGWPVWDESATALTASTNVSLWSWGERITVEFHSRGASITSRCALFTQCVDWGKNRQNVHRVLSAIEQAAVEPVIDATVIDQ
jgi:hypothetical protein